jgi:hypothetical protein
VEPHLGVRQVLEPRHRLDVHRCILIPEDDDGSSDPPMCARGRARSLDQMKKRLLFLLLVTGLLVLALGGWTVQGLRWAVSGGWTRGLPQPA